MRTKSINLLSRRKARSRAARISEQSCVCLSNGMRIKRKVHFDHVHLNSYKQAEFVVGSVAFHAICRATALAAVLAQPNQVTDIMESVRRKMAMTTFGFRWRARPLFSHLRVVRSALVVMGQPQHKQTVRSSALCRSSRRHWLDRR